MKSNLQRLIQLADQVFDVKNDPGQLNVDQQVMERLREIHPNTISEFSDVNGPAAWVLVIPTRSDLMNDFIENRITEKELFEKTLPGDNFQAIYLCSALVLDEYRRQGFALKLLLSAIESMREKYEIKALFAWPFTAEGEKLAQKVAEITKLPLKLVSH